MKRKKKKKRKQTNTENHTLSSKKTKIEQKQTI